ncbi:hypothetical protein O3M35_006373 [Rhynocoris fuscipes]|uniref:Protein TOPAZ1 domain-containing protein n=1 Tax=Rhynocoris fuscipes TaxID=488301 RepID=A0AAW1DFQ5_9HEMI
MTSTEELNSSEIKSLDENNISENKVTTPDKSTENVDEVNNLPTFQIKLADRNKKTKTKNKKENSSRVKRKTPSKDKKRKKVIEDEENKISDISEMENDLPKNTDHSGVNGEVSTDKSDDIKEDLEPPSKSEEKVSSPDAEASDKKPEEFEAIFNILKNDKEKWKIIMNALNNTNANDEMNTSNADTSKNKEGNKRTPKRRVKSESSDEMVRSSRPKFALPATPPTDRISRSAAAALRRDLLETKLKEMNYDVSSIDSNSDDLTFRRKKDGFNYVDNNNKETHGSLPSLSYGVNQLKSTVDDLSKKLVENNNDSSVNCQNSLNINKNEHNHIDSCTNESSKLQVNSNDESVTNEDNIIQNTSGLLKKKLLKKMKLKCKENNIEEQQNEKLKPGVFSNFKPSSLLELVKIDENQNKSSDFEDNSTILKDDGSCIKEVKDCESLTEKIERMKINMNDKKQLRVTLRKLGRKQFKVEKYYDKIKESIKKIEGMNVEFDEGSVVNGEIAASEKEVNNKKKAEDKECKNDGFSSDDESSSINKDDFRNHLDEEKFELNTSRPSTPIVEQHSSDNIKLETISDDKTSISEEKLSNKCMKNYAESDASETDSGNFKRCIKFKENPEFSPFEETDENDEFSLPDSENVPSAVEKPDRSFDEESNDFNVTDESSLMDQNQPISPDGEEEKCFWDIDSDDERNINDDHINDINFITNSKKFTATKYLVDEKSFNGITETDDIDEEMYVEEEAEEEDEDDDDDEEEGEIIDIVGIPIDEEYDSTEKGYNTTENVKLSMKIPKCFVKKDPNPIEMVELFDEKEDEKIQKKFGESNKWAKADLSSVVTFDVTRDILRNFCPYIFFDGICGGDNCAFSHIIPVDILKKHPSEEVWLVIEFMLKQMTSKINITHDFLESILIYLDEKLNYDKNELTDCIEKIFLITAFIPFVGENRNLLWKLSLKFICKKGVIKWLAVKLIIKYVMEFFSEPLCKFSILWVEMLESFEVDKFRRHTWDIIECLVEPCDFTLPPKFLTAALADVINVDSETDNYCKSDLIEAKRSKLNAFKLLTRQLLMTRSYKLELVGKHELHAFLEKACKINDLRDPVCRIRQALSLMDVPTDSREDSFLAENFDSVRSLKRSRSVADLRDISVKRRIVENDLNNTPIFEREKMAAALNRALEVSDLDLVIKILKENHKKLFYQGLINKLYIYYNKMNNESHPIKNLLNKIHKDESVEAFVVKQSIGRVVVTLMFQFVKLTDWHNANTLLMLLHAYKLNPITLEALVGECSQVRKAVTCSEIHYHSGHYKSAIKVLINYSLFKRENWKLKGDESDLVIVERISNYLLKKLIEKKEYEHVITLFKAIFQEIGEDQGEIDLMNYYEELLHGLFDESDKYALKCIELYCMVNEEDPTVVLGAVTFRTLLVLAYRTGRHDIAFDIAEKCVRNNVYPPIHEKERIIRIHKCLLEEELEIYVTRWFKWFMKVHGVRSCPIKLQFTNDASEDKAMNSKFGMPKLLKQIDSSLKGSFNRLENVLSDISHRTINMLKIKLKNDGIILSSEATDAIIRSLLIYQFEGGINGKK